MEVIKELCKKLQQIKTNAEGNKINNQPNPLLIARIAIKINNDCYRRKGNEYGPDFQGV